MASPPAEPPTARLTVAACIAPLIPTFVLIVALHFIDIGPDRYGLPSYFHAQDITRGQFAPLGYIVVLLGLPIYQKMKPRGWNRLHHFAAVGLILGLIGGVYFLLADLITGVASYGAPATPLTPLIWLATSISIGAATTTMIWLIARPDHIPRPPSTPP